MAYKFEISNRVADEERQQNTRIKRKPFRKKAFTRSTYSKLPFINLWNFSRKALYFNEYGSLYNTKIS